MTASVEEELTEDASLFINKTASSFEKAVKNYVQAKRNLKTAEKELEVLHDQSAMRYPSGIRPFKSPLENVELDKPLVRSMTSEVEFQSCFESRYFKKMPWL